MALPSLTLGEWPFIANQPFLHHGVWVFDPRHHWHGQDFADESGYIELSLSWVIAMTAMTAHEAAARADRAAEHAARHAERAARRAEQARERTRELEDDAAEFLFVVMPPYTVRYLAAPPPPPPTMRQRVRGAVRALMRWGAR